ncbi:MAG: hypothetical protein ACM3IL_04205, partial [Deltaproteobacteria bacterium]
MRNRVVIFLTLIGLSFIALSLLNIQIIQGRKFRELSDKNCIRLLNQSGARGRILDRNNKLIIS